MTKIKAASTLYENSNASMNMVLEFERRAETLGHQSLVKEAVKYAEEWEPLGWLSKWRTCPMHTVAGLCEIYEQL